MIPGAVAELPWAGALSAATGPELVPCTGVWYTRQCVPVPRHSCPSAPSRSGKRAVGKPQWHSRLRMTAKGNSCGTENRAVCKCHGIHSPGDAAAVQRKINLHKATVKIKAVLDISL